MTFVPSLPVERTRRPIGFQPVAPPANSLLRAPKTDEADRFAAIESVRRSVQRLDFILATKRLDPEVRQEIESERSRMLAELYVLSVAP